MSTNTYVERINSFEAKNIILGLQHLIAMFGATVLVPLLTGFNPSVALFTAGVGTLIFHFCTDHKVPVFLGSSFAFIPLINEIHTLTGDLAYAQGGIIAAGLVYILMSFIVKKIGVEKVKAYLPSHIVGPMIIVIGLKLVPVAFDMASSNFTLAFITLGVALSVSLVGKGLVKQLSILIAVLVGYFIGMTMNAVDLSTVQNTSGMSLPGFTAPKFSLEAIMIMVPVVLAVFMEHLGDITTNGAVVGKDFIKDPGLHKTLLGDGLATLFAGFMGGPANTTYGENTGVLAITKNYNPSVLKIAACFAIILSLFVKLGAILSSIPVAVIGGISFMLFSMIALVGVQTVKKSDTFENPFKIAIMTIVLLIGLVPVYLPQVASIFPSIPVPGLQDLSLAALVGITLNAIWMHTKKAA